MIPNFDVEKHRYTSPEDGREAPSVTRIISGVGLAPPYPDTPESTRKKLFGTAVHLACELASAERLDRDGTHPEIIPYVNGFTEKAQEMKIRPIYTEMRGLHGAEWYAGTLDLFSTIYDGDLAIIDLKTGTPPRCSELQTAGYEELLRWVDGTQRHPKFSKKDKIRRFTMQLFPNRAVMKEHTDPYDSVAFIAAVRLFKWISERRKMV